jgi:hypothetical protein
VIDSRFSKVLDKKSGFNTITKFDKTGKRVDTQDKMMQKFYRLDKEKDGSDGSSDGSSDRGNTGNKVQDKYYDANGNFAWKEDSSDESSGEDDEEGEHSQDEESIEAEMWDNDGDIPYAETNDEGVGCRLAINKLDWELITATDMLALFRTLCTGDRIVTKVQIYPSLFGLEQMKKDSLYGPPTEIFQKDMSEDQYTKRREAKKKAVKKKVKAQRHAASDEDSSSEELDMGLGDINDDDPDAYDQRMLRKYEIQKMKYYYAVVTCNSKETAMQLFDEYNGFEFEHTNLKLHMSFVPDDMKFTQKLKQEATSVPANFTFDFANQGYSRALGHTKVKLTWDQTDT